MNKGLDNICNIVGGDFDYVCNPNVLSMYNNSSMIEIENVIHSYLERMECKGIKYVSIYFRKKGIKETEALAFLGKILNQHQTLTYIVHYFELQAVDKLFSEYAGTPILYSVTAEKSSLLKGITILKDRNCPMIVQPVDDNGIGVTLEHRIKIINSIIDAFCKNNISKDFIYVDPLSPTVYFKPCCLELSIQTTHYCTQSGIKTVLWPENAARGYRKKQNYIYECFSSMAVGVGLNLLVAKIEDSNIQEIVEDANIIRGGIKDE